MVACIPCLLAITDFLIYIMMRIAKKAEIAVYEELNQMITASSTPRCLSRLISDRKSSQWWHLVTDDPEMGPSTAAITNLSFGKSLSSNITQRPLLSPIVWAWKLTVVVWSYTLLAFYDACMMHDLFLLTHRWFEPNPPPLYATFWWKNHAGTNCESDNLHRNDCFFQN